MDGNKLRFILKKSGIKYKQFALLIGKSVVSVQRWVSMNENVGEIYTMPLRRVLSNKVYNQIEKEWVKFQQAESAKAKEWDEWQKQNPGKTMVRVQTRY